MHDTSGILCLNSSGNFNDLKIAFFKTLGKGGNVAWPIDSVF